MAGLSGLAHLSVLQREEGDTGPKSRWAEAAAGRKGNQRGPEIKRETRPRGKETKRTRTKKTENEHKRNRKRARQKQMRRETHTDKETQKAGRNQLIEKHCVGRDQSQCHQYGDKLTCVS